MYLRSLSSPQNYSDKAIVSAAIQSVCPLNSLLTFWGPGDFCQSPVVCVAPALFAKNVFFCLSMAVSGTFIATVGSQSATYTNKQQSIKHSYQLTLFGWYCTHTDRLSLDGNVLLHLRAISRMCTGNSKLFVPGITVHKISTRNTSFNFLMSCDTNTSHNL